MQTNAIRSKPRAGFTLVQLAMGLGLMSALGAMLFPAFARAQRSSHRQSCDVKLKSIALALDAFKSERGAYPANLGKLGSDGYLTDRDALQCPRDPRDEGSYNDGYVTRAPGDAGASPVVTCPFHEDLGGGNQARLGRFTTQFATRPAVLTSGNAVQVQRAGESKITGYAGMPLGGGDNISVARSGTALITFADGSTARLRGSTDISVLQSFVDGQSGAPLYTLIRQIFGEASYTVNHGSRFDVATPAATAGARGTAFEIKVKGPKPDETELLVTEGKVVLTTLERTGVVPLNRWITASAADIKDLLRFLL